jgi:hypothetical protein
MANFLQFGYSPFNPAQFQYSPVKPTGNYNFSPSNPVGNLNLTVGGQVIDTTFVSGLAGSFGIDLKKFFDKNPELAALIDLGLSKIDLNNKNQSQLTINKNEALQAFIELLSNNAANIATTIYTKGATLRNNIANGFVKLGGNLNDFNQALVTGASYGEQNISTDVYASALPVIATLEKELRAAGVNVDELLKRAVVSTYNNQVSKQSNLNKYILPAAIILGIYLLTRKKK